MSPEQRAQRETAAVVIQRFWMSLKWQKLVAGLVKPDLEQHLLEFEDEDVERKPCTRFTVTYYQLAWVSAGHG